MSATTLESRPEPAAISCARGAEAWPLRRSLTRVTVAWMFGAIWFNVITGAPIVAFAKGLGASYFQFGLLAAIPYVAALFSLPGSLFAERHGGRKSIFLNAFYIQRGLCFGVAAVPVLLLWLKGSQGASVAVSVLLVLMFLMHAVGAAGSPSWVSWMADVVPKRIRGSYFSKRRQWGIVSAVPAALATGWGLEYLAGVPSASSPLPGVSAVVFWTAVLIGVTAFFGIADIALFRPLPHTPRPVVTGSSLLQSIAVPLKDRPFMTMSLFVGAINFTVGFTNQFAMVYVIDRLGVGQVQVQLMLLVAPMLLQLAMLPAWGAAVDRMGRKPLLMIAGLGLIPMGFGWCAMGQGGTGMAWLGYVLFAGGSALWTGIEVANFNGVLDAGGRAETGGGSGYHAVNTVVINLAGCGGGLIAGLVATALADWHWQPFAAFGALDFYDALFALSGLMRAAALIVLAPLIVEPAAKSVGQTLRFIIRYSATGIRDRLAFDSRQDVRTPTLPAVCATIRPEEPADVRSAA
ncbi:MFS transporter [Humisphaera borealis]|uniref:MFS transporter n=1 Tax=Humisphaera borealis TaxID=2807512 RepID=A0A7M2WZX1_9BACT|nr:MFS transporter [Humisphaera borealis]QOV90742.1 MFS transporter [Humisphaera borealis]